MQQRYREPRPGRPDGGVDGCAGTREGRGEPDGEGDDGAGWGGGDVGGRRSAFDGAEGAVELRRGGSVGAGAGRAWMEANGAGGRGRVEGRLLGVPNDEGGFESPGLTRARLNSRQQVGHRHSTMSVPSPLV